MATLWRNDVYLGRIRETAPAFADHPLLGTLEPTAAMAGIEPMMQCCDPDVPNSPMLQFMSKRIVLDEKRFREGLSHPLAPIPPRPPAPTPITRFTPIVLPPDTANFDKLPPLSPEEATSVPADKLLEIRSDEGRVLPFSTISLACFEAPDGVRSELWQLLGFANDRKEGWLVMAHGLSPEPET